MGQVTLSEGCPHARRGERTTSGSVEQVAAVAVALGCMAYPRDVNMAEEAEMLRLERGSPSPRALTSVIGSMPSWALGVPLVQMNMEAGAASEEAEEVII